LRYEYGELRLTRLNLWACIALGQLEFHCDVKQYGAYFAQFYGPILFIFGVFAVILNAMQVVLAVQSSGNQNGESWNIFGSFCKVFSVFTLFVVLLVVLFLIALFLARGVREVWFALRDLYRRNKISRYP